MNILNRLRGFFPKLDELGEHEAYGLTSIFPFEGSAECFDEMADSDTELFYHNIPEGTLNGLRRRIPGVHEDFPPDSIGVDLNELFDTV